MTSNAQAMRAILLASATAVIRHFKTGGKGLMAWLEALLKRKPRKVAAVALANKMARIAWALLVKGGPYRARALVAAA